MNKEAIRDRANDRKLVETIFKSSYARQLKKPEETINVGYGYNRSRHILEDLKMLIEHEIKSLNLDFKYGLITREYLDKHTNVLNQLKKSTDSSISAYFS